MNRLNRLKEAIKEKLNLRDMVAAELAGYKGRHRGRYDTYPCPFHQEQRGHALVIYDTFWKCFGKCDLSGDAIEFIRQCHNMDFTDALTYLYNRYLKGISEHLIQADSSSQTPSRTHREPSSADWQRGARQVIARCEAYLWDVKTGKPALDYLRHRGFTDETIKHARLGYLPGHWSQWKALLPEWGKRQSGAFKPYVVPCGIVIPWIVSGAVWGIKVRRASGDTKYVQVADGNLAGSLYLADDITPGQSLVITEGEFDALTVHQIGQEFFSAVAPGSASNTAISVRWYAKLASTRRIYCLMDTDSAGSNAGEKLTQLTAAADILRVPDPFKDINEMYIADRAAAENFLIDHICEVPADD